MVARKYDAWARSLLAVIVLPGVTITTTTQRDSPGKCGVVNSRHQRNDGGGGVVEEEKKTQALTFYVMKTNKSPEALLPFVYLSAV